MDNIYLQLLGLKHTDHPMALASVAKTVGSTPQKPGSSAIFNRNGLLSGTVGGGILEGEVQQIAQDAILTKESGYYHFMLDGEISRGDGAICGGQAGILVDASPDDHRIVYESVKQSLTSGTPGILVTRVAGINSNKVQIQRYWFTAAEDPDISGLNDPILVSEIQQLLIAGLPGGYKELNSKHPGENHDLLFLLEAIFPLARLVIAGAGHIGKALSHIGKLLGFEITVVDDRPEYANSANLPDADHIINEDIGKAMEELQKTPNTFIVILTRGHKDDARALKACIGSDIAYIGMIGSKRKVARMQKDFMEHGWATPGEWNQIHAPVGLDIQSESVQEIAVSIAAQLVRVKNCKKPAYV